MCQGVESYVRVRIPRQFAYGANRDTSFIVAVLLTQPETRPMVQLRRFRWQASVFLALALLIGSAAQSAAANVKVWLNTNSGVYHCPGGQYYGNTKKGKYLSEREAVSQGYRAAYGQACSPQAPRAASPTQIQSLSSSQPASGARVWVNSSSNVYHCPGSRYYGNTKKGRYVSESEAIASGNRPAYGARC